MSGPVDRETYEQMLREDVAALPTSMPSLERDHIIAVLRWSVSAIYGPPYAGDLRPSCVLGCERLCMGWMDFRMGCAPAGGKPPPAPLFHGS